MNVKKLSDIILKVSCTLLLAVSLVLTFTVSDYYIFNRISEYGIIFVLCQWIKKAGLLLLPLAAFYKKKSCSDIAKYILLVAVFGSYLTFGNFFDITSITENSTPADLVYAHINEFIPKTANIALFFTANFLYVVCCACLVLRDGFSVRARSFLYLPLAIVACMPLNFFENFFDISNYSRESFLWFKNFTIWHLLAIVAVTTFTVVTYLLLRNKDRRTQDEFLAAIAIVMLIQYHSKDSVIMGDGYNVYHTVFACIPLFICNLGIYVVALSIFLKKKVLYAISFFVHAAGAVTVFVYFGKDEMSNYGIFASYSILYFCLTHCLLFALSVLPSALGHYKFKFKDCIIPLIYYFVVIIVASIASGVVSSASMSFSYNGYTLQEGEWLTPNYAFTQVNPLPFEVPFVKLTIWKYDLNALYILGLYAVYVGIFFVFNGLYYGFNWVRHKILGTKIKRTLQAETAASLDENLDENKNKKDED